MIPKNHALALRTQSSRHALAFSLAQHHAAKLLVHSLCIAVEVRNILVDHLKPLPKRTPCLPAPSMTVARCMDIRPGLVHGRMYQETRSISRARRVPSHDLSVIVDEHH